MEWAQVIGLGVYLTGVCVFFYRLNEKTIKEWRDEHKAQMEKMDKTIEKSETHWREMFLYMNGKLDKLAEKK